MSSLIDKILLDQEKKKKAALKKNAKPLTKEQEKSKKASDDAVAKLKSQFESSSKTSAQVKADAKKINENYEEFKRKNSASTKKQVNEVVETIFSHPPITTPVEEIKRRMEEQGFTAIVEGNRLSFEKIEQVRQEVAIAQKENLSLFDQIVKGVTDFAGQVAKEGDSLWKNVTDNSLGLLEGFNQLFNPSLEQLVEYQINLAKAQQIAATRLGIKKG